MHKKQIRAAVKEVIAEFKAPDETGLPCCYSAKRKLPCSDGRKRLQWCLVPRSDLTEEEIWHYVCEALRKGSLSEAYRLVEERGLITPDDDGKPGAYEAILQRLGVSA
jgi:hypothetical protein